MVSSKPQRGGEPVYLLTRRVETEAQVLQETAASLDPDGDAPWIQEKVWLSQQVDKLRVMHLEMKNEKAKFMVRFHRSILGRIFSTLIRS